MDYEQTKVIAVRMKTLREDCGYSIEEICKKLDISIEKYISYESADSDITVGFLYAFATLLNVDLITILTGSEPKLNLYSLVKKGEGLSIDRNKPYAYQNLAYTFNDKKAEPFLVTVEAQDKEPSISSHEGQEINYMIEGRLEVNIAGHSVVIEEGDCLYFNSNNPHYLRALDNKNAKMLAIIIG